jgi:hypothetical protein
MPTGQRDRFDSFNRADVHATVSHILGLKSTRPSRQKLAMKYSRDVLKAIVSGECTDPVFASRQIFKLWRKLGLLR